jgi:hypothetical protein
VRHWFNEIRNLPTHGLDDIGDKKTLDELAQCMTEGRLPALRKLMLAPYATRTDVARTSGRLDEACRVFDVQIISDDDDTYRFIHHCLSWLEAYEVSLM